MAEPQPDAARIFDPQRSHDLTQDELTKLKARLTLLEEGGGTQKVVTAEGEALPFRVAPPYVVFDLGGGQAIVLKRIDTQGPPRVGIGAI